MKVFKLVLTLVTFSTLSFLAQSKTYQTSCNGCTKNYQFKNKAEVLAYKNQNRAPDNDFYVFNYKEGIAKKYRIETERAEFPGAQPLLLTREVNLSSSQHSNFMAASYAYNEITDSIQDSLVPEHIADSAYDLVGASYVANDISDYLANNQTFRDQMDVFISVAAKVTGNLPSDIKIVFKMSFKDGSWANFELTGLDKDGNISLSFKDGRDSDNNTITNNPSHYKSGAFRFNKGGQDAINNFLDAASRAGVEIRYRTGSRTGGSGPRLKLSCTGSAVKGDLVCKMVKDT